MLREGNRIECEDRTDSVGVLEAPCTYKTQFSHHPSSQTDNFMGTAAIFFSSFTYFYPDFYLFSAISSIFFRNDCQIMWIVLYETGRNISRIRLIFSNWTAVDLCGKYEVLKFISTTKIDGIFHFPIIFRTNKRDSRNTWFSKKNGQ